MFAFFSKLSIAKVTLSKTHQIACLSEFEDVFTDPLAQSISELWPIITSKATTVTSTAVRSKRHFTLVRSKRAKYKQITFPRAGILKVCSPVYPFPGP